MEAADDIVLFLVVGYCFDCRDTRINTRRQKMKKLNYLKQQARLEKQIERAGEALRSGNMAQVREVLVDLSELDDTDFYSLIDKVKKEGSIGGGVQ